MSETIPHLPAYPAGPETWRLWCEWCELWHTHGAGAGHRVAHCACRLSPYHDTGYHLIPADGPAPNMRQRRDYGCGGDGNCYRCPAKRKGRPA